MGFRVPAPDGKKGSDGLPLMVLPEGALLNNCYKVSYSAHGGMSIGYGAFKQGKKYFVKEVNGHEVNNVISLTGEKSMLERLSHPGIVKAHDFFEEEGFYYLVMEFIEGKSLDKLISHLPSIFVREKVIVDWAAQLYDIFEYLHGQNPPIIYRDLKPHNLIKDEHGRIHLVDFGIARVYKEFKNADTVPMGSIVTASPEHYGGRQTDVRSDIFTIGATLHFLLTNGARRKSQVFEFVAPRSINPGISQEVEAIIMKALQQDPDTRFQSVAEMRNAHGNPGEKYSPVLSTARESEKLTTDKLPPGDALKRALCSKRAGVRKRAVLLSLIAFLFICGASIMLGASAIHRIDEKSPTHEKGALLPDRSRVFPDLRSDYQVTIPEGYHQVCSPQPNIFSFEKAEPQGIDDARRYVEVIIAPSREVKERWNIEEHLKKHRYMINGLGIHDLKARDGTMMSTVELSYGFNDSRHPLYGGKDMSGRDLLVVSRNGRKAFVLCVRANPERFPSYEDEFRSFFLSFKDKSDGQ